VAEFQDAANAFVKEQIALNEAKRHKEVQQEVEREVAQRMQAMNLQRVSGHGMVSAAPFLSFKE
jgi:hypothetical protein